MQPGLDSPMQTWIGKKQFVKDQLDASHLKQQGLAASQHQALPCDGVVLDPLLAVVRSVLTYTPSVAFCLVFFISVCYNNYQSLPETVAGVPAADSIKYEATKLFLRLCRSPWMGFFRNAP